MKPTEYEHFVKDMISAISANGLRVYHNKEYVGKRSGRAIVVDVSFETEIIGGARMLALVECKKYSSKVKVNDVEEFHSKLDDIGAHKGIMFTTIGYQKGAVKTAKGRGIALALLTENSQEGEIVFFANAVSEHIELSENMISFCGNLRPWDETLAGTCEAGIRFESFDQMWSILYLSLMVDRKDNLPK